MPFGNLALAILTRTTLGTGLTLGFVAKDNFPLPTLSLKLKEFAHELYSGRGFFVLRTIPIDHYSKEELAIIFAGKPWLWTPEIPCDLLLINGLSLTGISTYVGSVCGKQDGTGAVLAHIKDLTISHAHEKGGIGNSAYTTDKQVFHTDVGDLIALTALEVAQEGGTSRISSGARVYNELAATRPDLIHTLSEPWPLDTFGGRFWLYHEACGLLRRWACFHSIFPTQFYRLWETEADASYPTNHRGSGRGFRSSSLPGRKILFRIEFPEGRHPIYQQFGFIACSRCVQR